MSGQILGLFVPSITAILAVTFAVLWLRVRSDKHVLAFSLTYVFVCVGFLIFHYFSAPTHVSMMLLVHSLYACGGFAMFWGLYKRVGRKSPLALFVGIQFVAAVFMVLSIVGDDMRPWLYAANLGHGIVFALAARDLMQTSIRTSIDKTIVWLVALSSALFFCRPVMAIIVQQRMTVEVYRASDFYALLMVGVGVLTLALAMAILAAVLHDQMSSVRKDSENDHLTGLKMRRAFEQSAMDLIDRSARTGKPVSMIVADIDHFKQVNDIWGHQAGDRAIIAFGHLIQRMVRSGDVCGRIGGEEFCLMIWDCEIEPAERLAERVRKAFAQMAHDGVSPDVRLTASFGVATCRPQEGFGRLFARADSALYRAKESGRNRVEAERRAEPREPLEISDAATQSARKDAA